jgi:hypothetical protein
VRIDVDLDAPRLAELRQELRVGEGRADRQQGVAVAHQLVGRPGAQQADRAGDVGEFVAQRVLAEERLGDAGAEQFGDPLDLGPGPGGAQGDQDRHLVTGVEDVGGRAQGLLRRDRRPTAQAETGRHHLELVGGGRVGQFLHVAGDDDRGRAAPGVGGADRPVQHVRQLLGDRHRLHELRGDVLEQCVQVHLLLVRAAHRRAVRLADDREHRHMVEFRVVQAVEQVDRPRPRGRHAHPEAAAELGVADRLERGHLLVPRLHETRLVPGPAPGGEQAVDAVARITEDLLHPPLPQPLKDMVGDLDAHGK